MQAVIISFDSLAANSLGCYGNDWIETPHLDRLAATGILFDRHFADTIGSLAGMTWANGRHALSAVDSVEAIALGRRLKSAGVATHLITATEYRPWQLSAEFEKIQIVAGQEGFNAQPDEVPFAQLVKAGLSAWTEPERREDSRLLWLHSAGPGIPPKGFDALYFEDFEERGEQIAELSEEARSEHPAVYAGAVSLLDHWLGELLKGIESTDEPTLIVLMAGQGYLWHRIKTSKRGESDLQRQLLCDQCVRTPLILKIIGDDRFHDFRCLRSDRLVQTCDLVPTLLDWFRQSTTLNDQSLDGQSWLSELTEEIPSRASLWIGDNGDFDAIRTADWLCIRDNKPQLQTDSTSPVQPSAVSLFAKPEDIWDVHDIASQQPEVIDELLGRLVSSVRRSRDQ